MYNSTSIANLPLTTLCHLLPKIYLLNNLYGDKVLFILYYFFFFYLSVFPFSQKSTFIELESTIYQNTKMKMQNKLFCNAAQNNRIYRYHCLPNMQPQKSLKHSALILMLRSVCDVFFLFLFWQQLPSNHQQKHFFSQVSVSLNLFICETEKKRHFVVKSVEFSPVFYLGGKLMIFLKRQNLPYLF